MTRTQAIDSAVKQAMRKFGYGPNWLVTREIIGQISPTFHKAVLTAWDKINPEGDLTDGRR